MKNQNQVVQIKTWKNFYSPAHVDVSRILTNQRPNSLSGVPQLVLYVHLLILIARERHMQFSEQSGPMVLLELIPINVVVLLVATAKEQNQLTNLFVYKRIFQGLKTVKG